MKTGLVLTFGLLLAEGRGVTNRGHEIPATLNSSAQVLPVTHVAAEIGQRHKSVIAAGKGHKAGAAGQGNIIPPLVDVASDKKFYGPPFPADYPDDISPPAEKGLFKKNSVYPKIQEEGFFDKDYIKDENSDRGQWKAQSDYDAARTKAANEQRQAENAAKRADHEANDVEQAAGKVLRKTKKEEAAAAEAKKAADEAGHSAHVAADREAEARAKAERAAKEEEEANKSLEEQVKDAEDHLAQETQEFKGCQKQLEEAKAKVRELEQAKERLESEGEASSDNEAAESKEVQRQMKAMEEAKAQTAEAKAHQSAAENKVAESHEKTEAARHELERQKAEKEEAQRIAAKAGEDLKEAEKELDATRSTLRHIRGLDAVPAGATEPSKQAGASTVHLSAFIAVAMIASIF